MTTEARVGTGLGERSPNWTLPLLDGGEFRLGALRGHKALLFFWASW
ncbi:MAG: peroxiredoxin family protein [Chloroflexota bacterium]|nr:peroxiredoxin family protein [Chloroflexota bacterium]